MRIGEAIIQNRKITAHSPENFEATYKGKEIVITTNHGHRKPRYEHLTCYDIEVRDIKSGMLDVNTYEDFHNMEDAIRHALKGACLIAST